MIDNCFKCNKELKWAVDEYIFQWTSTGPTTAGLMPFCHGCRPSTSQQKRKKPNRPIIKEQKGPGQLTLNI